MAVAIQQTVYSLSCSLVRSLLFALCRRKSGGVGFGDGVESGVGGGAGLLKRVIFFSSGVKGGRSCVQSS